MILDLGTLLKIYENDRVAHFTNQSLYTTPPGKAFFSYDHINRKPYENTHYIVIFSFKLPDLDSGNDPGHVARFFRRVLSGEVACAHVWTSGGTAVASEGIDSKSPLLLSKGIASS